MKDYHKQIIKKSISILWSRCVVRCHPGHHVPYEPVIIEIYYS